MKLLSMLIMSGLTLAVFALPGCQTNQASPITTIATDELITTDAEKGVYKPIFPSRSDVLTKETEEAIEAHNNVYFCRHKAKRPLGFDTSVCADS